jgi:hypothetical protein
VRRLRLERLIARQGPGRILPTLRTILAGDCPQAGSGSIYDQCQVHFPQLPVLFRGNAIR